jgi:hypothetical protein
VRKWSFEELELMPDLPHRCQATGPTLNMLNQSGNEFEMFLASRAGELVGIMDSGVEVAAE